MTRKHYEKFAALFAGEKALLDSWTNGPLYTTRMTLLRNIILSTADIFAQDNPRFDRERFYTACGL